MNHDGHVGYTTQSMDVNGNGHVYSTAWAGNGDGVLVFDKYGDGQVHNSTQYAFSQYGGAGSTDLQGLQAAFDTNHDGKLDAGDSAFKSFSVWVDANHNGVADAGEMRSLTAAGIVSIDLVSNGVASAPAAGVTQHGASTAALADGGTMAVADDSFSYTVAPTVHGGALDLRDLLEAGGNKALFGDEQGRASIGTVVAHIETSPSPSVAAFAMPDASDRQMIQTLMGQAQTLAAHHA